MYTSCTHVHLHLARDVVADINASRVRPTAGRRTAAGCDPRASPAFPTSAQRRGVQLHAVEVAQSVSTPDTDANEREIRDGVYEGQLLSKARLLPSLVASQTMRKRRTSEYTRLAPWCLQAFGSGRTTVTATGSDISVRDQRVRLLSSSMALAAIGKLMGHISCLCRILPFSDSICQVHHCLIRRCDAVTIGGRTLLSSRQQGTVYTRSTSWGMDTRTSQIQGECDFTVIRVRAGTSRTRQHVLAVCAGRPQRTPFIVLRRGASRSLISLMHSSASLLS